MQITAITAQKRDASRCSVYIDGEYSFSLNKDQLLVAKIYKGLEVDSADIARLQALSLDGKLYESAIRKLTRRPHSRQEIEQYLQKKKATADQIASLVQKLIDRGYINDTAFAGYWVEQRQNFKQASSRSIRYELRQKGVSGQDIDNAFSDAQANDGDALQALIAKLKGRSRYSDQQKLIRYLQTKGFSYGDIKSAIAKLEGQE